MMEHNREPDIRRTIVLLIILIPTIIFALVYTTTVSSQEDRFDDPIFECLGDTDSISKPTLQYRRNDGMPENVPLTHQSLEKIWTLTGDSIWIGYENGGWAYPENMSEMEFERYWIFGKKSGVNFWVIIYVSDDYTYGFVFENTEAYTDSNGEHYGQHPCGGWEIDTQSARNALIPKKHPEN